jgi:hypothetical protein
MLVKVLAQTASSHGSHCSHRRVGGLNIASVPRAGAIASAIAAWNTQSSLPLQLAPSWTNACTTRMVECFVYFFMILHSGKYIFHNFFGTHYRS